MQKSEFIEKIKVLAKTIYAEKSNPLADADDIKDQVTKFPVIDKFPPLKKVMEDLFDFQYEPFVKDVEWVAPRPTTFRIKLVNGADFFLIYEGKDGNKGLFIAQVSGKKYYLESLPEEQQASEAIARLLRYKFNDRIIFSQKKFFASKNYYYIYKKFPKVLIAAPQHESKKYFGILGLRE